MLEIPSAIIATRVIESAYLPPQRLKPLLLRLRVDPGANDKGNDIEEWHPSVLRQELLGKGQCQGRDDPTDFHDWHEAGSDRRSDLVEGPSAGNDGHGSEVDCVLDGCDLRIAQCQSCSAPKAPKDQHSWDGADVQPSC